MNSSILPGMPFEDPIIIFALAMVVFLIAPIIFERYGLPGIIGIIVVGAAIGPNGLGILERSETFVLLGEVGIVYLMFLAGLEIDLGDFVENRNKSLFFGGVAFLLPQGLGLIVGYTLLGLSLPAAALFGAVFSSHTLLAYPVVKNLDIVDNEAIMTTIGGTIFTETAALLVLAVVLGAVQGDLTAEFWLSLGAGLVALFVGIWLLVPRIGRWFFRSVKHESYFEFLFVMAVLFVCAVAAELAGVKHIIGAFLAGLALNRLIPKTGTLMNRIEFVGNALLIPFFLISVGMLVNVSVIFEGPETLAIAGSIIVLVFGTKLLASWTTGAVYGYTTDERLSMFGLSTGQAAAALAIVLVGFEEGVPGFGEAMVNGVVLMILVVSFVSIAVVKRYGSRIVDAQADTEYDPSDEPQRILVPLGGNPETMERLLNFGVYVRSLTEEPIHTLTVVESKPTQLTRRANNDELKDRTKQAVTEAEERLKKAVEHGSSAEVSIETLTRVENNIAGGIVKTITEKRISTVVVGWPSTRRFGDAVFGNIVDQLVEETTELVLVSKLRESLNLTDRVVCVVPRKSAKSPGFYEAVHVIKNVADELGVELVFYTDADTQRRYERLLEPVKPDTKMSVESPKLGHRLDRRIPDETDKNDFVIVLSPRRHSRGWEPWLSNFTEVLPQIESDNVVIAYLSEHEDIDRRRYLRMT